MTRKLTLYVLILASLITLCHWDSIPIAQGQTDAKPSTVLVSLNDIAKAYVKVGLTLWQQYDVYIDTYIGPVEWKTPAKEEKKSLAEIKEQANALLGNLQKITVSAEETALRSRRTYLITQLRSIVANVRKLDGEQFDFDEEAKALYGVTPPTYDENHFQQILNQIDKLLPAANDALAARLARFKAEFIIPKDKMKVVFNKAFDEARSRTKKHIDLPKNENIEVEYVTGRNDLGYNGYQGNAQSKILINIRLVAMKHNC